MDERKNTIRELEKKKQADIEGRIRLLERFGETLFQRIGEGEHFLLNTGDAAGAMLIEYRRMQNDISLAVGNIRSIEATMEKLAKLEESISEKEAEYSRKEKKLGELHADLGKALLLTADSGEISGSLRQQEEILLEKIEGQEKKLVELEDKEGGIFKWLGKNAQMAVSKALLLKNKTALQRVYRNTGEKYLSDRPEVLAETGQDIDLNESSSKDADGERQNKEGGISALETDELEGDASDAAVEALELRRLMSSLADDLLTLRDERRNIKEILGTAGTPSRRIQGLEKQIMQIKDKLPGVCFRFGVLATEGNGSLSSLVLEEDKPVLERAKLLKVRIAGEELEIEKLNAVISIDIEKSGIEKMNRAIIGQRQKIADAEEAITGLERRITESEKRIKELAGFINSNSGTITDTGIKEDHGRENTEDGEINRDSKTGDSKKGRDPGKSGGIKGSRSEKGSGAGSKKTTG